MIRKFTMLLASAGSLPDIEKLIVEFYCGSKIELRASQEDFDLWSVYNSKGKINGVRVVKKGKRYRFESI